MDSMSVNDKPEWHAYKVVLTSHHAFGLGFVYDWQPLMRWFSVQFLWWNWEWKWERSV